MPCSHFDLIVYGASGYTGRLVAEYLARRRAGEPDLKWAMAGRDRQKLAGVREEIGASHLTPLLFADACEPHSLCELAARSRLVLSTVGPYQLYGSTLVAACAKAGTDYVDLCGEPAWMREMIDAYEDTAKNTGARIVFSCGFDSVPFDLGVLLLQNEARLRYGAPCREIKARVRKMKGALSGGTIASLRATHMACKDQTVADLVASPFALTPGFQGPEQPPGDAPLFDESLNVWLAPFIMVPINTKNIHRSNMLLDHVYDADFRYSEMLVAGDACANAPAIRHFADEQDIVMSSRAFFRARTFARPGSTFSEE